MKPERAKEILKGLEYALECGLIQHYSKNGKMVSVSKDKNLYTIVVYDCDNFQKCESFKSKIDAFKYAIEAIESII